MRREKKKPVKKIKKKKGKKKMKENAGYKIVKEEMYNEKYGIVLGINEKAYVKYVTWEFAISYNETEFFLGHYFENEKEALEDYHKRLAYYYKVLPF